MIDPQPTAQSRSRFAALALTISLLALTACGGGSSSPSVVPSAIQGTAVSASFTANSTLAGAAVVQNVACVANGPCTLAISTDGTETSLGTGGQPIFQLRQTTASQTDVVFTSDYPQVTAGNKKLTLLATAGGVTLKRLIDGIQVAVYDPAPVAPAGSAFANLADMTQRDEDPVSINSGGVTDPLGRPIVYSATGLPNTPGVSTCVITINPSTGLISGGCDVPPPSQIFEITVTATPGGSAKSISKSFRLTINDTF